MYLQGKEKITDQAAENNFKNLKKMLDKLLKICYNKYRK